MIKNLLFDLGGVIMEIRRKNCVKAFEALGMAEADTLLGEYSQSGVFAGLEDGSLSVERFHDEIRRIIGRSVSDDQIDTAFQRFLVGIPEHRLEALEELHKRFSLYLVSNTNPIMWNDEIRRNFCKQGKDAGYYFDGVVLSYETGAMKPDRRIFDCVVERFGIKPDETLFFDDSRSNLEAAAAMGFHTLLVSPGSEFMELFKASVFSE